MARWFIRAAVVVTLVATVGCDDSPRTIATARPVGSGSAGKATVEISPEKAPDKSHPKAVELVTAAVSAHTGGKPELLQKFKTVHYLRQGKVSSGGLAPTDQKWDVRASWPDRFRILAEMGPNAATIAWSGNNGWKKGGAIDKLPMSPQDNEDMRVESTGEWLLFLFPLTESDAILAPVEGIIVGDKPADGVRLWHPRLSDAVVYFDRETKHLVRFAYIGREGGQKVNKDVRILALKEFAGVQLPEKTSYKLNGAPFAEWTTTTVEPVDHLDPKLFEEP